MLCTFCVIANVVNDAGPRKTSLPSVASHTMVWWRMIFCWSRDAVLDPRRGLLPFVSLFSSRHLVLLSRRSSSSSSTPPQSLGMDVSRPHRRNRSSMDVSRRNFANWSKVLGYHSKLGNFSFNAIEILLGFQFCFISIYVGLKRRRFWTITTASFMAMRIYWLRGILILI